MADKNVRVVSVVRCCDCGCVLTISMVWYIHQSGVYCFTCAPVGSKAFL